MLDYYVTRNLTPTYNITELLYFEKVCFFLSSNPSIFPSFFFSSFSSIIVCLFVCFLFASFFLSFVSVIRVLRVGQ